METKTHEPFPKKLLVGIGVAAFWIALWELAALAVGKEILLPAPLTVLRRLGALSVTADFRKTVGVSLLGILLGITAGTLGGILLAVLCFRFRAAEALLSPLLTVVRATPVASFIVLCYLWFSRGTIPGFISFLMVLPVIAGSMGAGLRAVDPALREVTKVYGMSAGRKLRCLWIPSLMPGFRASLVTVCGLGWKAGVAAEALVRAKNTIGNALIDARLTYETADVFAWTAVVIAFSMLLEALLRRFLGKGENRRAE